MLLSIRIVFFACAALAITEGLLRVYGLHRPVMYVPDADAGFCLAPNQHIEMLTGTVDINGWGLRENRPIEAGPHDGARVLVLGDSVSWGGLRVPQDALLTTGAERILGQNTEVLNGGVNGASVVQMIRRYEKHWTGLAPDAIVVYAVSISFERAPIVDLTGNSLAFPTEAPRWALGVAIELGRSIAGTYPGLKWMMPAPAARPRTESTPDENFAASLAALDVLKRECGVPLHVVLSPTRLDDAALRATIAEELKRLRIPMTDLTGAVPPEPAYYVDPVHFNEAGHRAVAPAVAGVIGTMLKTENI